MADERLSFLTTHLGTLLYFDPAKRALRHNLPGEAPRNLLLRRGPAGEAALLHCPTLPETDAPAPPPGATAVADGLATTAGPDGSFGLAREGRFLSARPNGAAAFIAPSLERWERFRLGEPTRRPDGWQPLAAQGGTQLMEQALGERLGPQLRRINLRLNHFESAQADSRPAVVWFHNEASERYDWLKDRPLLARIAAFVFVSHWQCQGFIDAYRLPPERCIVLRNAVAMDPARAPRPWPAGPLSPIRCAFISAPYRGLDVLLDAWEGLMPVDAELHIWSSLRLWGAKFTDQANDEALFARARSLTGVSYHGIAPNEEVRAALETMHFLIYPCTVRETSCIAAIEGMAAGCRVILPSLGALAETVGPFARVYPFVGPRADHARLFAGILRDEFARPWGGDPGLALAEQEYCRRFYDWEGRVPEWQRLIDHLTA